MSHAPQRGSVLVLAVFVLAMLAGMGLVLLSVGRSDSRKDQANRQEQGLQLFLLAETGLEHGRAALIEAGDFNGSLVAATGPNGRFDFDPDKIEPRVDASGRVVGFEGYGDDVPLCAATGMGDGLYTAFLTNDPAEMAGAEPRQEANERVMIFGIAAGSRRSLEVVQAIVEPAPLLPSLPPCTLTLLGPNPRFEDGSDESSSGAAKTFWGTDCAGQRGVEGAYVPVICVQGCTPDGDDEAGDGVCAEDVFDRAIQDPRANHYVAGPFRGSDTVLNLNDPASEPTFAGGFAIDPAWTRCEELADLLERAREMANFVCARGKSCDIGAGNGWSGGVAPTTSASTITFADGNLTVGPAYSGRGMLFVTGTLRFDASAAWSGPILVIGTGQFVRSGVTGSGLLSGATVLADIAGPDRVHGTADDCQNGFGQASYREARHESGDTMYCSADLPNPLRTYDVTHFRQR